jgi:cysteine-rich repeat protein
MSLRIRGWRLGWLIAVALSASVACGDSAASPPGSVDEAGGEDAGGHAGVGHSAGKSGAAGSAPRAGSNGDAGNAAAGGLTSIAGSGGSPGVAGVAGVAGDANVGGDLNVAGEGFGGDGIGGDSDDYPFSGCVLTGTDPTLLAGDGDGDGDGDGGEGNEPAPLPATVTLGAPCATLGDLGCSQDLRQSLVCDKGSWALLGDCPAAQSCDTRSGVCADVRPECAGHADGFTLCVADELNRCAAGGIELEHAPCCGVCAGGVCEAPRCGNGKTEPNERCDDGNTSAGDGCEPDCKPSEVLALSAGGAHTCALLRGGAVRCWGANDFGQLGAGSTANVGNKKPYELAPLALGAAATAVVAGTSHSCALLKSGRVRCWGKNDKGQLGLGHTNTIGDDEAPSATNAEVSLGAAAVALAAGGDQTCAVLKDGSVRCWGANQYGQLGLGHTKTIGDDEAPSKARAQVSLGGASVSVAVAREHACALLDGGLIRCWGHNDVGQLGLGYTKNIGDDEAPTDAEPIDFRMLADPELFSLSAGGQRACVGISQGNMPGWMRCWGYNGDGGLGVGLVENRPSQKADGWGLFYWGSAAERVVVGGTHQCVLLHNNELHCFGLNDKGQLGRADLEPIGDNENCTIFPPVSFPQSDADSLAYAVTMTAGDSHTCALLDTAEVRCWGHNDKGQLGLGFVSSSPADYVGGDAEHTPDQLPPTRVLPPAP